MAPFEADTFFDQLLAEATPDATSPPEVVAWRTQNWVRINMEARRLSMALKLGLPTHFGVLRMQKIRPDGEVIDYGLASLRVVTTAGVNYIVGVFAGTGSLANLKYHGIGTGSTAEATTDTALVTELTTQYNPDNVRATGTTATGASANVYRTVATNTVDATAAVTEHGIFSQAATGGGTLLDRSVFSVINLASGDGLASTYDLTFAAGG